MTRYFMHNETGSVFTIEELQSLYEEDENFEGSFEDYFNDVTEELTEVVPIVDNPDDSTPDDWEALK